MSHNTPENPYLQTKRKLINALACFVHTQICEYQYLQVGKKKQFSRLTDRPIDRRLPD